MTLFNRVDKFHKAIGEALPSEPTMLDRAGDFDNAMTADYYGIKLAGISEQMKSSHAVGFGGLVTLRAALILEELAELLQAETMEDQVDALADAKVFIDGSFSFMAVNPEPIEGRVMDANEAKIWPDGTIHRDENGKWEKPPGWTGPEAAIREELERQTGSAIDARRLAEGCRCPKCETTRAAYAKAYPAPWVVTGPSGTEYIVGVDLAKGCNGCGACSGCEEPSE